MGMASAPSSGDHARRRTVGRALARIAGDGADQRAARRAANGSLRARARSDLTRLLLGLRRLLLLLLGLFGKCEGVGSRVLHRPCIAVGLGLGLLRGSLPLRRKDVDVHRGGQRFLP